MNAIYVSQNTAPVIADQNFTVAENSAAGTEVGTVVATDPESDELTFSILSGNTDDAFALNSTSGLLTVNYSAALDYETTTNFVLSVQVSDGNLTSDASITIYIDNVNGIASNITSEIIKVYPNPVSDKLYINIPKDYFVEIYSIIGEKLLTTNEKQVDLEHLDSGIYFTLIKNSTGENVKSIKILKK